MPATLNEIKTAAESLSPVERSELMDYLLKLPDERAVKSEWKSLAKDRLKEMEDGAVMPVPFDQLFHRKAV